MTAPILSTIEDAIVGRLRWAFESKVRTIEGVPAQLTADELKRVARLTPALLVAFLTADKGASDRLLDATSSWSVFVVVDNAAGDPARRRGDARGIGAFAMIEVAGMALHGWAPQGATGPLRLARVENLFSDAFAGLGLAVYALTFTLPLELASGLDAEQDIGEFLRLYADWDVPVFGNVGPEIPADEHPADAVSDITVRAP